MRSKLTNLHIFLKQTPKNIKINAFNICDAHLWFANSRIQKLGNVFFNAQQMVVQLIAYLVFSSPLYRLCRTFQLINIFPFEERAFVLKSQVALNELEPNSTNIMCSLITNKYINRPN